MTDRFPFYLGGEATAPNHDLAVTDKYSGETFAQVALAGSDDVSTAISLAAEAAGPMRRLAPYQRQGVLNHCVRRFEERADELAHLLCREAGKPIKYARGEVARLIDTFRIAAEESVRIVGEVMPLEISPQARGYSGMWKRVPIGPCLFITPFNFPLNLVAHKVAPALAMGCPFILRPARNTPLGALVIGEILAELDLPRGAFSILPCSHEDADLMVTDDRLKLLSFTGSGRVGWDLKARAGKKKVALELGGNAACVVDEDADIDDAVRRIIVGAFYQSGQSCIGVQRIMVHDAIYDRFRDTLVAETEKLVAGDPSKEETFVGPIISEREAGRIEGWIRDAVEGGGTLLCGGKRTGNMVEATLLENVPSREKVVCDEVFGPVAVLSRFDDFDAVIDEINDSRYGLQAGIFTRDIYKAHKAWNELHVGGVIIGDIPSWRVDHMPYGGVKDSGIGREGIRFSMEEMSEIRLMVLRTPPSQT